MATMLAKPPWACYVWCNATSIFLEFPCPTGKAPHVAEYSKSEGGLAKALAAIAQVADKDRAPVQPGYFRHGEAKATIRGTKPALKAELVEAARRTARRMERA